MEDKKAKNFATAHLECSAALKMRVLEECLVDIAAAANLIAVAFRNGGKLMLCGNGGSAADCQHTAGEFVSLLNKDYHRRPALPAIALTTDSSFLTAYANDFGYEGVFCRQLEALAVPGDVLLGISTSGNSPSIVRAVEYARDNGIEVITLTGAKGVMTNMADIGIAVPSDNTQHIQEAHLAIEHIVCGLVEQELFPDTAVPRTVPAHED